VTGADIFADELRRNSARLAYSIHDLLYAHTNETAVFHMALDLILINLMGPYRLKLTEGRGGLEFDTAPGRAMPYAAQSLAISPPDGSGVRLALQLFTQRRAFETDETCRARLKKKRALLKVTFAHLRKPLAPVAEEQTFLSFFRDGFRKAVSARGAFSAAPRASWGHTQHGPPELERMMSDIEINLKSTDHNLFFFEPSAEDRTRTGGTITPAPRIFFSHCYVDERGAKKWRVHALSSQIDYLAEALGYANAQEGAANSGFVRFPGRMIERAFSTLPDACASGVASWIDGDPAAWGSGTTAESQWRALVLPIHVQGVPWIAVTAVFLPLENIPAGFAIDQWAMSIYSQLFPQIIAGIRQLADIFFLRRVTEIALETRKDSDATPQTLVLALEPIYRVFPHRRIRFVKGSDYHDGVWNGCKVPISFVPNDILGTGDEPIDYGMLPAQRVAMALCKAAERYALHQSELKRGEGGAYFSISHNMKNLIESSGWEQASLMVGPIAKQYRSRDVSGQEAGLKRALDRADRALSMAPMISGLAYIGQLLGAKDKEIDWNKFADWLPPGDATPSPLPLEPVAKFVQQIACAICFGREWPGERIAVTWAEPGEAAEELVTETPGPLRIPAMHLPPFKKGSSAIYPFFFALSEPIQNAVKAMHQVRIAVPGVEPKLRIHVTRMRNARDKIAIDITNDSMGKVNKSISGLDDAARLLERLEVVKYLPSRSVQVGDTYDVTIPLRIYPMTLAEAIRNGRTLSNDARSQPSTGSDR
jgi:hypothetical protein